MDGVDDAPPVSPISKPKSKAAAKPKPPPIEPAIISEKSKITTVKAKAKTRAGARTRAAIAKAKDADDEKTVKVGPHSTKEKPKRKPKVLLVDEEEEEGGGNVESTRESLAAIEVPSSPPEPPKAIFPKREPVSRVTLQEVLFNSSRGVHASLIVALIIHTRNVSQMTHPRPRNQ